MGVPMIDSRLEVSAHAGDGPFGNPGLFARRIYISAGLSPVVIQCFKSREASAALRHNRATQKARAMLLLPSALSELMQEGIAAGMLESLDQVDVAEKAAERFDRSVNRLKYSRSRRAVRHCGLFSLLG